MLYYGVADLVVNRLMIYTFFVVNKNHFIILSGGHGYIQLMAFSSRYIIKIARQERVLG